MGRPKKYDIRSVNFGEPGHPARVLIEKYVKQHGNKAVSSLIRKLVTVYLQDRPDLKGWKAQMLIHERKEIGRTVAYNMDRRRRIDDQLRELDIDPDEIF